MAALGLSKSLQVESLEERLVMTSDPLLIPAGNVAAYMNQGTLEIRGDALNNNIDVTQVTDGQFQVSGINGTLINGRSTPLRVSGVADLGAGDDSLILSLAQVTTWNSRVNGGSGRDTLQERTNSPESPFLVGFEVPPPS